MFDFGYGGTSHFQPTHTYGRVRGTAVTQGVAYPSPFFDLAHTYLPPTVKQMFKWCRYYYLTQPLIAAVVNKMAEYPITDLVIDTDNRGLRDTWERFFESDIQLRPRLIDIGLYYMCLHGDTKVVTDRGVFRIRDMVGETHNVLSEGGVYRPAKFKSYGRQRLLEVEFRDGSTVLATPEHQWPVLTSTGKTIKVPTTELEGRSVPRTVAPRPEQDENFYEGVRHGFVFGDGTLYNGGEQARACFFGAKDQHMVKYFEGRGCPPYIDDRGCTMIHGLPERYKELPPPNAPASYWYGFVCGFLAADGSVDTHGCVVLTQKSRATLKAVADQLPRIGMVCGPLRGHAMAPRSIDGREIRAEGDMHFLTLLKQSVLPQDLLLPRHRARFEENFKPTSYGQRVAVRAVRETGIVDEVFCCTEEETHTFVIGNGVLTGNCYGNALVSLSHPFVKWLKCKYCGHSVMAKKAKYRFRTYEFILNCDKCSQNGNAIVEDQYLQTSGGTKLLLWNPEDIDVVFNPITHETAYFYSLPIQTLNDMAVGRREVIEQLPQVFIDAAKKRKSITLNKDNLFHIKRPSVLSGPRDTGWGIPIVLPVLKDVFYLQIMKKAQEAILLERIVPLTVIFPQQSSGTADPYTSVNLVDWKEHIAQEIQRWRLDRNYIPILPLPIGNQVIGGDGRALLMSQEIKIWSDQIIAGMNVPNEFIYGGLQWSGSNVSLRMLENQFMRYLSGLLLFIKDFVIKGMAAHMGWPEVGVRFKPFKMADDLQRKAFLFQLNQAGKVSDTTLITDADLNADEENELMKKETKARLEAVKEQQLAEAEISGEAGVINAKYQAKAQTVMMQEQQQAAAGMQGTAPGEPGDEVGAPSVQQPGGPPQQGEQQGNPLQQIVQRLRALSPESQRTVLSRIEQQNPELANQLRAQFRVGGSVDASPNTAGSPLPTQLPPRRGTESAMI